MADMIYTGSNGVIKVDGVAVASIRSFTFTENVEVIDATTMSASLGAGSFRTNLATFASWDGSVEVFWTTDDGTGGTVNKAESTGMLAPSPTKVTIEFYPSGEALYELGYTADALITSRSITSSVDGMIEASISVVGVTPITTTNGTAV